MIEIDLKKVYIDASFAQWWNANISERDDWDFMIHQLVAQLMGWA